MPDGRTAFNLIQNATDTDEGSLMFFLFDLLFLDGENLTALPLIKPQGKVGISAEKRAQLTAIQRSSNWAWPSVPPVGLPTRP